MPGVLPPPRFDSKTGHLQPPDYSKLDGRTDIHIPTACCDEERLLQVYSSMRGLYEMVRATPSCASFYLPATWHSQLDAEETGLRRVKAAVDHLALMSERVSEAKQYSAEGCCSCCRDLFHRLFVYSLMFRAAWSRRQVAYERRCWSPTFMFVTEEALEVEARDFIRLRGGPQQRRCSSVAYTLASLLLCAALLAVDVCLYSPVAVCQVAAIALLLSVALVTYYSPPLRRDLCPKRVSGERCSGCPNLWQYAKRLCAMMSVRISANLPLLLATLTLGGCLIKYPILVSIGLAVPAAWMALDGFVFFEADQNTEMHMALLGAIGVACAIIQPVVQLLPAVREILLAMFALIFVFGEFKGSMSWREMCSQGCCAACGRLGMLPSRCLSKLVTAWLMYRTWVQTALSRKRVWTFRSCREFFSGGWRYPLVPFFEDKSPCELAHALNCGLLRGGGMCVCSYRGQRFVAYRSDYEGLALQVFRVAKEKLSARLHVKLEECRIARQAELALARRMHEFSVWSVENLVVPDFHWKHYRHQAVWRMLGGHVSGADGKVSGVLSEMTPTHLAVYLNELMSCLNGQTRRWKEPEMQAWIRSLDQAACPLEFASLGKDIHGQAGRVSAYRTYEELQREAGRITAEMRADADHIQQLTNQSGRLRVAGDSLKIAGGACTVAGAILAPFTCGASLVVTAVGAGLGAAGAVMGAVDESWERNIKDANKQAEEELKSPEVMHLSQQLHTVIISMTFVGYTQQVSSTFAASEDGQRFLSSFEETVRDAKTDAEKESEREGMESFKSYLEQVSDSLEAIANTAKVVKLTLTTINFYNMSKAANGVITQEMRDLVKKAVLPEVSVKGIGKSIIFDVADFAEVGGALDEAMEVELEMAKIVDTSTEIFETAKEIGEAAETLKEGATAGEEVLEASTKIWDCATVAGTALGVVAGAVDIVLGGIDLAKGIEELKSDGGKVAEACRNSATGLDKTVTAVRPFWP